MRCLAPALLLAASACGLPSEPSVEAPLEVVRDAIVGGTPTSGDPNVFMLLIQGNNGQGSICTATLIDRRTLLTAAHCVDPTIIGATSAQILATNAATESQIVVGQNTWRVTETRAHPSWNSNTLTGDIAMALLDGAPPVTPKAWNNSSLSGMSGQALRAVGYGTTGSSGSGSGVKRTVDLTIRQLTFSNIYLGNQSSKGICHGDSGGPSFHTFADGVERVIGVHSYTLGQTCVDGADTRVDANATFIQTWLQQKEAPSCAEDGRCVTSCPTPDIDCVCVRDGQCTTACPDLTKDPDCSPDCVPNGVCALGACPAPDTDCVAEGERCTSAMQCPNRKCVVDPQHASPYCSKPCTSSTQCSSGMECDPAGGFCRFTQLPEATLGASCTPGATWCGPVGVCAGPSAGATVCAWPCARNQDCTAPNECMTGVGGTRYCATPLPPLVFVPAARTEGPVAATCASAPGLWAGLGALVLTLRRRRARR